MEAKAERLEQGQPGLHSELKTNTIPLPQHKASSKTNEQEPGHMPHLREYKDTVAPDCNPNPQLQEAREQGGTLRGTHGEPWELDEIAWETGGGGMVRGGDRGGGGNTREGDGQVGRGLESNKEKS